MIKKLFISGLLLFSIPSYAQRIEVIKYPALEKIISQTSDTVLVVNFWATWCKPCVEELPHFEKISKKYKNKQVRVVLINLDLAAELNKKVKPFLTRNNLKSSTNYLLDETDYNTWIDLVSTDWSGALPFTMIVGRGKSNRKTFEQPLSEAQLEAEIKTFIQ